MPSLVVIFGRDRGRHFDLPRGAELLIGRSKDLPYRLNDPSVSRQHLQFVHQQHDGKCLVLDMQSRNGARINEKRLFHSHELQDGDVIQVGYTLLVFVRITFDVHTSINPFLETCEKTYEKHLNRLRDHGSMHSDRDGHHGYGSSASTSGTMHLGHVWGKKSRH